MKAYIFIFLICPFALFGQNVLNLDSLYRVRQQSESEEGRILASQQLTAGFLHADLNKAAIIALETYRLIAQYKGDSSETWQLGQKAAILDLIGTIEAHKGNIPGAIDHYDQSVVISKQIGDVESIAKGKNNIGFLFLQQGETDKAFNYFKIARTKLSAEGNIKGMAIAWGNMGLCKYYMGELDSALIYYHKTEALHLEIGDDEYLATTYNSMGSLNRRLKKFDLAEEYYTKSLEISKRRNDRISMTNTYGKLASLREDQGNPKAAIKYAEKGLKLAESLGVAESVVRLSNIMSALHTATGDHQQAMVYYKKYVEAKESLKNTANSNELLKKEMLHVFDETRLHDSLDNARAQEKQAFIYNQKVQKQRVYTYTGIGGFILTIIFSLYMYRAYRQKKASSNLLAARNQEITDSITYAKRIQEAILPPDAFLKELLPTSFVLYKPKDIVAGDFYWLDTVDDTVFFAVADCTGHGVPGAMVSVVCHGAMNRSLREFGLRKPGELLDKTRELVVETFEKSEQEVKDGMDVALCAIKGDNIEYAGANNPLWILRNGEILETKATKQPAGKVESPESFKTHSIPLESGDMIYSFSDGYVDQFGGPRGKKFMRKNLKELLVEISSKPVGEQRNILSQRFEDWRGNTEQVDDVCVIGVRV